MHSCESCQLGCTARHRFLGTRSRGGAIKIKIYGVCCVCFVNLYLSSCPSIPIRRHRRFLIAACTFDQVSLEIQQLSDAPAASFHVSSLLDIRGKVDGIISSFTGPKGVFCYRGSTTLTGLRRGTAQPADLRMCLGLHIAKVQRTPELMFQGGCRYRSPSQAAMAQTSGGTQSTTNCRKDACASMRGPTASPPNFAKQWT